MSDFSLFSLFTAGLACLIPLSAAYTQPKGDAPKGNPISQPGLNSVVPVGEKFTITWDPTTKGTVTLVLLKGPSSNAEPLYPIVENTPNDGVYVWDPKTNLQPSDPSSPAMGYGIQLIDDATGQYQYTTQFGISNPQYKKEESSSSEMSKPTGSAPGYGHSSTQTPPTYHSHTVTSAPAYHTPSALPKPTWYTPNHNVTMVAPTYAIPTMSTSASSASSATSYPSAGTNGTSTPSTAPFAGSASTLATSFFGLILAAGVAVLAL